jgi:hypothetical protein
MTQNKVEQDVADDLGPLRYDNVAVLESASSFTDGINELIVKDTVELGYNVMKGTEYCMSL